MGNKIIYILKLVFIMLVLFLIIYTCSSFINEYPKNNVSYKDSLLINYTLDYIAQEKSNFNWYKWFSGLDLDSNYFKLQIENIYFSPDSLKALVFITYNYRRKIFENSPNDSSLYVAGRDIALLRNSKYEPWELFFINFISPSGYSDRTDVRILMEKYYRKGIKKQGVNSHSNKYTFEEILNKNGYILDENNEIVINPNITESAQIDLNINFPLENYIINVINEYGLEDEEFWTESVIWKKGIRLPDLYLFQTNSHIIMEDYIMNYNIPYPDSIIQMYKEK